MDVRYAALKALIKILDKDRAADDILKIYSGKVIFPSELHGLISGTVKYKITLDFSSDAKILKNLAK